jgi:hypothetical protein
MLRHLLALLALASTNAYAQKNYIDYHREIIKAEELFLINNLEGSLKKYKDIFNEYPKPFAKDCFTALQIACLRNDTTNATYFFQKSFEQGVTWVVLNAVPQVKNLLSRDSYNRTAHYNRIHPRYLASLDTALRKEIVRRIHWDNSRKNSSSKQVYAAVLDQNIHFLDSLAKHAGYPGEHLIGILDQTLYKDPSNFRPDLLSSIPSVMYFHHYCGLQLMKKELFEAIRNGELQPAEYALMYEWSYAYLRRKQFVAKYKAQYARYLRSYNIFDFSTICPPLAKTEQFNFYLESTYYSADTTFVNKCRREIGMASIQHYARKKEFARKHSLILFFGMFGNL